MSVTNNGTGASCPVGAKPFTHRREFRIDKLCISMVHGLLSMFYGPIPTAHVKISAPLSEFEYLTFSTKIMLTSYEINTTCCRHGCCINR